MFCIIFGLGTISDLLKGFSGCDIKKKKYIFEREKQPSRRNTLEEKATRQYLSSRPNISKSIKVIGVGRCSEFPWKNLEKGGKLQ